MRDPITAGTGCTACGCMAAHPAHAIVAALAVDDFDAAISAGLLVVPCCDACTPGCQAAFVLARDARVRALAARVPPPAQDVAKPALPPAAAAALARAKAKAAGRQPQ